MRNGPCDVCHGWITADRAQWVFPKNPFSLLDIRKKGIPLTRKTSFHVAILAYSGYTPTMQFVNIDRDRYFSFFPVGEHGSRHFPELSAGRKETIK
jgi:hypothetical protein